jgi:glutathione synthase/RimK-type ligase-like ATP-grasp enzyme
MKALILTRPDFGHNTHYIINAMKDAVRLKSDAPFPNQLPDWVIRWGCTAHVPNGPKVLNKKSAIQQTTNKGVFRHEVSKIGHAPKTWRSLNEWLTSRFNDGETYLPVVIRPNFHQRGEDLYFCTTEAEVKDAITKLGADFYISEYIEKTKEFRVFVAQGRALIVAEKKPANRNAVAWGCVDDGGELDYQFWNDWNTDLVKCAVESFNLSKLDFAAIDIMEKDGKFYFLEANTAPEVWEYYGTTLGKVFNYIIDNDSRDRIPAIGFDNWKDCIHPALSPLAKVA